MKTNIKLFISFFVLSLSFLSLYSKAATCPPVESITRIPDEYQWQTTEPGWSGYFMAPITGKGHSYNVKKFIRASWVKSHDSEKSAGFIQCDYAGDFSSTKKKDDKNTTSEYEIIRFTQDNAQSALTPDTAKLNWSCRALTSFPKEACICYGNVTNCNFRLG